MIYHDHIALVIHRITAQSLAPYKEQHKSRLKRVIKICLGGGGGGHQILNEPCMAALDNPCMAALVDPSPLLPVTPERSTAN